MGLFNDIDPIFFYHKSVKPLLAMGFNGVVTPSGKSQTRENRIWGDTACSFGQPDLEVPDLKTLVEAIG